MLYNDVKEKILIIEKLKKSLKGITQDKHEPKLIKDYLRELKEFENVDFKKEIESTEKKLRLM